MQIGTLTLEMAANVARLQQDMQHARKVVDDASSNIRRAADLATKALGLLGVGLSVNWAKNLVMGSIEGAAALNDLAIQAGVTVESLSALASIGRLSGQNAESIALSMNRLTRSLSSVTEEGKGAGFALQAMGLDIREFQQLSPDQQFKVLADTLNQFQDGSGKAAVAMALLGKEGAKMLPMLKDLALAGEIQAKVTTEQAAVADNFSDNLVRAKATSEAWQKQLSMGMVPAMDLATQAFLDIMNGTGGIRDEIAKLSKDGTITRWTKSAIIGLSYVADGVQFTTRVFGVLITTLGTLALGAYELAQGNFARAGKAFSNGWTEVTTMFDDKMLGQRLRDRMKEIEATAQVAEAAKPVLDASKLDIKAQEAAAKAAQKLAEEAEKLAQSGANLYASLTLVDGGLSGDFMEKWNSLNAAYKANKITSDELILAQKLLLDQQPAMKKALEDRAKLEKQINDERERTLAEAWKQVDVIEAQAKQQEMANAVFGKGKSALAELTLAEMESQLAALEATENVIPGYIRALELRINAQKSLIKAMKEGEVLDANQKAAQKAADEWERTANKINDSIVDALMRGFESGKDFAKNMRDTIVNMFKTMILRPVVQAIISPIGAGVASAFGVSGAQAAGLSTSSLGMIGTIKSVYDNIVGGFAMLGDKVAFAAQDIGAWLVNNTTGVLNQAGSSLMSSAGALGTAASYAGGALAGYGIGTAISGQYAAFGNKNIATVTGTAIGAVIAGPIGAAIGGAIGGLVNRAFGMGAKETQDYGLSGQFTASGANLSQYSRWYQEGGWFRSDKSGTDYAAINAELGKFLNGAVGMTTAATRAYASAIGLSAEAVNGFSKSISISLKGLDDAAKEKAIAAAITGFGDAMAQTAYGATLAVFAKEGESASVTLARLGNSLMAVNQVLGTLNQNLLATSASGADAASKLLDLVGGTEAFASLTTAYYQAIYTEEERLAKTREQLSGAFSSAFGGAALPRSLAAYKALVEAQDLTTEAGRQQYAVLLQLAPAYAEVTKASMASAEAAQKEAQSKVEALRASGKSISEWIATLRISASTPAVSLTTARGQYLQALNLSRANDQAALSSITSVAEQYIEAARNQATSRSQFAAIVAQVSTEVSSLPAVKGYQQETLDALTLIKETIGLVGGEQLTALGLVDGSVGDVSEYSSGTMENTASALKAATRQIEALVFMNNDGLMAVSKNTAATLDYLKPMTDYLKNIDASTAKTAANPVVVNQSSGGGGLIGKVLNFFGFASGGVFGGQGIYNTPTPFMFNGGQLGVMGEAGPEAVLPLERLGDGSLGVRALPTYIYPQQTSSDSSIYMAALVVEVAALRAEVSELRLEARATAANTGKSQRLLERVTLNGDAMQTVVIA
jgi:hypothetical protein